MRRAMQQVNSGYMPLARDVPAPRTSPGSKDRARVLARVAALVRNRPRASVPGGLRRRMAREARETA